MLRVDAECYELMHILSRVELCIIMLSAAS